MRVPIYSVLEGLKSKEGIEHQKAMINIKKFIIGNILAFSLFFIIVFVFLKPYIGIVTIC